MNVTKKRYELLQRGKIHCYFCNKVLRPDEIDDIDYVTGSDKETIYLHRSCFTQQYFEVFGKEGGAE